MSQESLRPHLEVITSAGLTIDEIPLVLSTVKSAIEDNFEMEILTEKMIIDIKPAVPNSIPGALGRLLLLSLNNFEDDEDDNDIVSAFKNTISQEIDFILGNGIEQPILVSVKRNFNTMNDANKSILLNSIIENEVILYDLRIPLVSSTTTNKIKPTAQIEIDGALIADPYSNKDIWDTSTILVFDDFVENTLRKRLLNVLNNNEGIYWNDKMDGPDPKRWEKGGLIDIFDEGDKSTCWGLTEEATRELCFEEHESILEVEQKICALFSDFIVARLPEAVLGANVSPLTANAPTFGDSFEYHIDADPKQTPPSPWTDIFGRYFNRARGKPRFVSSLIYLNEEWNEDFGAPTQFYDPPTGETYNIFPRPGRCVIMDQDVTHTVVAPNKTAGALPRYSLVWKLILHPKQHKQTMKIVSCDLPLVRIGSADFSRQV